MSESSMYDVVILGTGPAGLQAAIHAARKKSSVLVLGRTDASSLWDAHIENFCCMLKITGEELLSTGREQAASFGAEFVEQDVLSITPKSTLFEVVSESGRTVGARSLVVATGTARNRLGVPGEKELLGRGVSYCVECDGNFFKGEEVVVVGNRSAAAGGALTMTRIASRVTLLSDALDVAPELRRRLEESGVRLLEGVKVKAITGENAVTGVEMADGGVLNATGVFIELGAKGVLELASTLGIGLDDSMKYVDVDRRQRTNVPGVFAAGDICGPPFQVAKAVGEGCVAGIEAAKHASGIKGAED